LFGYKIADEVRRRFHLKIWNVYNYFITYASLDGWKPSKSVLSKQGLSVLDRWILVRLNDVIIKVTEGLEKYDPYGPSTVVEEFVEDLSNWYVRRSRDREDKDNFYGTMYEVLVTLMKVLAPFTPFMSDDIYRNLSKEESVHLSDWPKVKSFTASEREDILQQMNFIREIAEKAHGLRKESGITLRQPLAFLSTKFKFSEEFKKVLMDEVNVKNIKLGKKELELDTKLTPELIAEGTMRDLVRKIQEERKNLGTKLDEMVNVVLPDWPVKFEDEIKKRALVAKISRGTFKVVRE